MLDEVRADDPRPSHRLERPEDEHVARPLVPDELWMIEVRRHRFDGGHGASVELKAFFGP